MILLSPCCFTPFPACILRCGRLTQGRKGVSASKSWHCYLVFTQNNAAQLVMTPCSGGFSRKINGIMLLKLPSNLQLAEYFLSNSSLLERVHKKIEVQGNK